MLISWMLKVGIALKTKEIQYLQNTYYVPGPGLDTISNPQGELHFAYIGLGPRERNPLNLGDRANE